MVVMYSSQALHSFKATDHIQVSWLYCNVPSFCHFESTAKPNNYFKNSLFKTCRTHFHFSRYSVFGTIFKSNCDNLFLEGLCMLIVKGLAIRVCLWTSTKVLWQDEIVCLSSVPASHWSKPKQDCHIIGCYWQCCDWFFDFLFSEA